MCFPRFACIDADGQKLRLLIEALPDQLIGRHERCKSFAMICSVFSWTAHRFAREPLRCNMVDATTAGVEFWQWPSESFNSWR